MTGYSAQLPAAIAKTNGGYQVRYNIQQVERVADASEIVLEWQFDYINVPDLDRGTIIDALITDRFSYASQLGKLAIDRDSQEWQEYQAFRESCYQLADGILAGL